MRSTICLNDGESRVVVKPEPHGVITLELDTPDTGPVICTLTPDQAATLFFSLKSAILHCNPQRRQGVNQCACAVMGGLA